MKILHVSSGDFNGGAARAAYRIHRAQVKAGMDSHMLVLQKGSSDERVIKAAQQSLPIRVLQMMHRRWLWYSHRDWSTNNPVLHTFGHDSAGLVAAINSSDADIVNLHWISRMLSVKDIGRLRKPIVWTLHDMWAFCGGEHYASDDNSARFRVGYQTDNRPDGERGPDLNRRTWEAKRRVWARQEFTIIGPSHWLADCAQQSVLLGNMPIHVIPNPLDTERVWRPIDRVAARTVLGLPMEKKLILFGADKGTVDPRKGADLLRAAILRLSEKLPGEIELLIYGQDKGIEGDVWPCPVHWLGVLRDDRVLAQAYSASDVMIVPSRQDNLPNTAVEAQACGTPVAAFDVGGLPDIVIHRETGWLAKALDTEDLAEGIFWLLDNESRNMALSAAARKRVVECYSESFVAEIYRNLYENLLVSKIKGAVFG